MRPSYNVRRYNGVTGWGWAIFIKGAKYPVKSGYDNMEEAAKECEEMNKEESSHGEITN